MTKLWARIVRRLFGREVLPDEIKRVTIFEDAQKIQARVDVVQRVPADQIEVRLVIGDPDGKEDGEEADPSSDT